MKHNIFLLSVVLLFVFVGCKNEGDIDKYSYNLGVIGAFSELVNSGTKQLALSATLTSEDMNAFIDDAKNKASEHDVSIYRESDLIVTNLFPADIAKDLDVLLLFQGTTLDEYLALKEDVVKHKSEGTYNLEAQLDISRRFGRMLSYSPRKINKLISQNTSFRTMDDFGIKAHNVFLYYKDVEKATEFYSKILGLEVVADYGMASILRVTHDSYIIIVDAAKGMHTAEEPKTVAIALLTDKLEEWYNYLKEQNVEIKYEYKPKQGGAHDGFVAVDPEGYLLEFEMFKQHPENEPFIPILEQNKYKQVNASNESTVPEGLGFHSTITWLYYKDVLAMQNFYENVFGLELVADQGWAKIYRVSETAFLAIVDERRGMHKFSKDKAVNVGFIIDDIEGWFKYVQEHEPFKLRTEKLEIESGKKYTAFVGYGPEDYYLEFDFFHPHQLNTRLLEYLNPED
ncbi:VOC family protein [Flavobacteriaceae bacterium S0825]|uniref:VOC family protein n=1 Tax=Gaetbulibacter sp. S0825 TaxID=2720084 RepID=UPI001431DB29|nr:VOC family protein [Gaetbulibacter sp. S0825]MCK0109571.1 VOC family protein [Flavobacteriaceae bacterium S0825]NIX65204.1 VOC family protein [Gaetbulibacter sp. S0825]